MRWEAADNDATYLEKLASLRSLQASQCVETELSFEGHADRCRCIENRSMVTILLDLVFGGDELPVPMEEAP